MSASNTNNGSPHKGRYISVEEFTKSELLSYFNSLVDDDLLVISNRNLHLKAIHKEFLKFSTFITQPLNQEHFLVFLKPVFQHLYLLILSHKGKSDAERFVTYFRYLPIPSNVFNSLLQCQTCEDVQMLINGHGRIRITLTSNAYHMLMSWLRDCFTESLEMFNILRVLHENFHVDICHDKDEEDFAAVEFGVLEIREKLLSNLEAQKNSEPEFTAETCETPDSDDEVITQKMSEIEIVAETSESSKMPESPEMSEVPEMPEIAGFETNVEVNSSMFKLRESARTHLEKVKQMVGRCTMEQIEAALLNPPDPNVPNEDVLPGKNDQKVDFLKDPASIAPESSAFMDPLDPNMQVLPVTGSEEDDTGAQENVGDQVRNDGNEGDDTEVEDTNEDPNDAVKKDAKDEEDNKYKLEPNYVEFKSFYKSNFHSAYPITISGKDVLCSSDVSPDLRYLACGFESCKICTWRLSENNFKLEPIGTLRGHKGIVYALSIDSNRRTLISGSHDCTVRIWDIEESTCLSEISAHSAPVYAVCASPNSKYFLSASEDKHIVLVWYDDVYPVRVYAGHSTQAINCVRFHPNCAYFASASSDGSLFLFKINDDSCPVRMFSRHKTEVFTLSFSPCGKRLASADVEGILIIWDILTYTPIKTFTTEQRIRSISYDMCGSLIAAVLYYKSWKVYNIEEGELDTIIEAESVAVPKSVHFSEDNKMFIIQYVETDKGGIEDAKEKSKTTIIS